MRLKITALLLHAALVLCLAACKTEPDLPDDPHVPLMNPFIGIWDAGGGEYWQFRTDGTGGKAASGTGHFPDTFSFFVYAGQDVQTAPSEGTLVLLEDSGGALTVTRYPFTIFDGAHATLRPASGTTTIHRVSGSPQVLSVNNDLIGEWSADWSWPSEPEHDGGTWSLKYREDGTLKTYHHGMHQFENAYALRGNTLVIFGDWRFSNPSRNGDTITAKLNSNQNGTWAVTETQPSPSPANWVYTKVAAAKWK